MKRELIWYEPYYIRRADITVVIECYYDQKSQSVMREPVGCYDGRPAKKWTECFEEVQG